MRKAAYVVAAILAGILIFVAVLPRVVSLEGYRPALLAVLEEKTGRKASFSAVSLSLFPGIGIKVRNLTLSGDPNHESEKLLSAPEAEFRLALLPLLSGRAELGRLILSHPAILLRKYADGSTSLTEMAGRMLHPVPAVRAVDLREAQLGFRIQDGDGRERAYDVTSVTARIGGFDGNGCDFDVSARIGGRLRGHVSLKGRLARERGDSGPFLLKADGDLFRQDISVEGRVTPSDAGPDMDLSLAMRRVRLGDLREMFREPPALLERVRPEGFARLSAKLSGPPEALGFEIDVDLREAGWTVTPGLQKFIDMPCMLVLQGHRFPDLLMISNAEVRFPPLLLIGNLSMVPSTGAYEWFASSRIASLSEFASSRGELLQRWSLAGRVTASGKGRKKDAGTPGGWSVGVDLGEVGFQQPDSGIEFRGLDGHLVLSPGALEFEPLAGLCNGQSFTLRGRLSQGDTATGPLALKMAYLDLDNLFPEGGHGRKGAKPEAGAETQQVAFSANLSIDAGRVRGIDFRDLAGRVRFEKGAHAFEALRAKVYGGELSATGEIETGGKTPALRMRVSLKDVEASELLSRKTRLGKLVSGPVTMTARIEGGIRDFADFSRTATGEGSLSLSDGKIEGIALPGDAARLAGLPASRPTGKNEGTAFSKMSADFRIGGGKIRTDRLWIESGRFGLEGTAALGFDRTIDFVGRLQLPAGSAGATHGASARYLTGPSGRIEIPLVISGGLRSPAMAIDSRAMAGDK
ncbi:MAG TPA: AsmA-like C-terminal region-containing protein [Candidatus Deferrimicrobiaceae bacterium]|jgi:hypothetical protein